MDAAAVADRLALSDLADGYAAAADRRDGVAFAALFLPEATLTIVRDGAEPSVHTGHEQLARIPEMLRRYRLTLHVVTNHQCTIDGDEAHGGAICQAHHLVDGDDGTTDLVLNIRYHDTYARTGAEWRIATREVHILWTSTHVVTTSSSL
ncbi:MAG: nuclear transport factor 2 family protein [Acidimicrobiales bacterium]